MSRELKFPLEGRPVDKLPPTYRFFPLAVPAGHELLVLPRLQEEGFETLSAACYMHPTGPSKAVLMVYILSRIAFTAPETAIEKEVKEQANRRIIS